MHHPVLLVGLEVIGNVMTAPCDFICIDQSTRNLPFLDLLDYFQITRTFYSAKYGIRLILSRSLSIWRYFITQFLIMITRYQAPIFIPIKKKRFNHPLACVLFHGHKHHRTHVQYHVSVQAAVMNFCMQSLPCPAVRFSCASQIHVGSGLIQVD